MLIIFGEKFWCLTLLFLEFSDDDLYRYNKNLVNAHFSIFMVVFFHNWNNFVITPFKYTE